ncbi:MAG: hypothetical protein IJD10_02115 [Clostridia bacterium]|nr:hypothetical protein [Clostridia bacterium]
MFRKPLLILFLLLLPVLSSCGTTDRINYLSHQTYPYDARGVLTFDGTEYEVLVSVRQAGDVLLQVISPKVLAGAVFELREGEAIVSCGALTEAWEDGGYAAEQGILLTARIFSLSGDDYVGAGVTTEGKETYSYAEYAVEGGTVTVYRQKKQEAPCFITAKLNGHTLSFRFMNES